MASFDGSGSSDPDGTIASYAWDFGDGATGTGTTPVHTYASPGDYTVALTVKDNSGATDVVTHVVSVTQPAPTALASDAFARAVAKGWGDADTGGTWTLTGSTANASVSASGGNLKMASAGAWRDGEPGLSQFDRR